MTALDHFVEQLENHLSLHLQVDLNLKDLEIYKNAKEMETDQVSKAINYTLDEDGHTGDWRHKFTQDYLTKHKFK